MDFAKMLAPNPWPPRTIWAPTALKLCKWPRSPSTSWAISGGSLAITMWGEVVTWDFFWKKNICFHCCIFAVYVNGSDFCMISSLSVVLQIWFKKCRTFAVATQEFYMSNMPRPTCSSPKTPQNRWNISRCQLDWTPVRAPSPGRKMMGHIFVGNLWHWCQPRNDVHKRVVERSIWSTWSFWENDVQEEELRAMVATCRKAGLERTGVYAYHWCRQTVRGASHCGHFDESHGFTLQESTEATNLGVFKSVVISCCRFWLVWGRQKLGFNTPTVLDNRPIDPS